MGDTSRISIGTAESADDHVAGSREIQSFTLRLIGTFAILALVLAAFGLHATIAYSVGQRAREIGIRVALGAQSHDVMRLVIGQRIAQSLVGIVLGAFGGTFAGRAMRALLYQVAPVDPITLATVAALLATVVILASYAPARRAVRVDPVETLRTE